MKRITISLFIILIIVASCDQKRKGAKVHVKRIPVDKSSAIQVRLNYLFNESVDHIVLEDSKAIIKDINKIEIDKKSIYILDEELQNILRFSKNGDFLNFCGKKGRGPGELFYPSDFSIEDSIVRVKDGQQNMKIFTKKGIFLKSNKLPINALSFKSYDGKLYLYRGYNFDSKDNYRLFSYSGNKIEKYLKVNSNNPIPPIETLSKNFNSLNNSVHLQEPLNNTIYKIENGKVTPIYEIDFGQYNLPNEVLELKDEFQIFQTINSGKYANIILYLENDTYLLFQFYLKGKPYFFMQNKKSHKTLIAKNFKNDISYIPFGEPMTLTAKNELIVKTSPYLILEREKELREKSGLDKTKEKEFFSLYTEITDYSNPIISIYKLDF